MNTAAFHHYCRHLRRKIPKSRIATDVFRTTAHGADASFYRMRPQVVVTVESEADVAHVLAGSRELGVPVTFRAAGTSLSGQAVTDAVGLGLKAGALAR